MAIRKTTRYSVVDGASFALQCLLALCEGQIPEEFPPYVKNVLFSTTSPTGDFVCFPTPLKEQEAASALKALEACAAAALADLRYEPEARLIGVDVDRTACFLMSAYLTTIDGMDKGNQGVRTLIPDTDLNKAQSILYRRLSANLYETKSPGEFYHIHGSLDASKTLQMIGLPPFNPQLTEYRACIDTIEQAVKQFTPAELEDMNHREQQAGVPVLTWEQFRRTSHGKALTALPPFTVKPLDLSTSPVPFPQDFCRPKVDNKESMLPQSLSGIKVVELCRVIAGPTIGRSLAAQGATVLKVTSPLLPDVPIFQIDVNTGKHATSLHLKNEQDRIVFESLLADADVIIDGYRPGTWKRLGYGAKYFIELAQKRNKGIVYVAEDCFGGSGVAGAEWANRPGWQQIADCVTGVAWAQGNFMGLDEPVVPPFPMSDYGTGILGCIAAMAGLHRRATIGGSWMCRTSLVQYDVFLLSLGVYSRELQEQVRRMHDADFFELRHSDSVDEVGKRAKQSMMRLFPHLFADDMMQRAWSQGFAAELRWPKEPVRIKGLRVGHVRAARPNGYDAPSWDGWEENADVLAGDD